MAALRDANALVLSSQAKGKQSLRTALSRTQKNANSPIRGVVNPQRKEMRLESTTRRRALLVGGKKHPREEGEYERVGIGRVLDAALLKAKLKTIGQYARVGTALARRMYCFHVPP